MYFGLKLLSNVVRGHDFKICFRQPSEFEKLVTDSVQRIKESALETERKEVSVLTNPTAKQEMTTLVNRIFLNFVQVSASEFSVQFYKLLVRDFHEQIVMLISSGQSARHPR